MMKSMPLFTCTFFGIALAVTAAPQMWRAEYLVSAAPLTVGAPNGDVSVAVNPADPHDLEVPGVIPEPDGGRIPATITAALAAKFPKAKIDKWSKENEDGKVVYDIEFKQDGRKFEADIFADGTIHNWEQQVAQADLPQPVVQALNRAFPNAALKEVMAVTEVNNGLESLQGYEIVVRRALRKDVEITIAPDGRVLEGPGAQK